MKSGFWTDNNFENLNKLKEVVINNPKLTNQQIADIFKVSIWAIRYAKKMHLYKRIDKQTGQEIKPILVPKIEIPKKDDIKKPLSEYEPLNWNIVKSNISGITNKSFKTILVIADTHVPYVNKPAIKSIFKLCEDIIFDGFVILGDYLDFEPISHWLKNKNKTLENKRMKNDYTEGNKLLDEFDKRLKKDCDKRFFYGNHEKWYYDLIEAYPSLEGMLDPKEELKLIERGYIVYDKINHIEQFGRLSLCHGQYTNQEFLLRHINSFKTNVMHGHLHSPRMRFETSPAKELAIAGYSVGCLCDLNPEYCLNQAHRWSHGFAILYLFENNYFDVDLKRIVNGVFVFNNKLYDGNI